MGNTKKCLFLLTELSGYLISCLKNLSETQLAEVHVVRWPVNTIAPFKFDLADKNIKFYERKDYDDVKLKALAHQINPDIIMCSGWNDKGYNKVCREYKDSIHVILGLDNPWRNTAKQNLATLIGPLLLPFYYTHCWVPGVTQMKYSLKLGFAENHIKQGAYSCDFDSFNELYTKNRPFKSKNFPKKIIFVGRYTKLKGTLELWDAFIEFQQRQPNDWELWCLGKGELIDKFPVHDKIKNFGFVQPSEMKKIISECGVFILPSHYEHWGVVVHEFAAAGFPLICTTTTGAAEKFIQDGQNGYFVQPKDKDSIINVFQKITSLSSDQLITMGDKSNELARQITPQTWSETFLDFFNN